MKKTTKTMILTIAVSLLPILLGLALYDRLPPQLPTHWSFGGEVNGWSSKPFAVFGLPALMAVLSLFVQFMMEQDPKKANMPAIMKLIVSWVCPVMSLILVPMTLFAGLGYEMPVSLIVCLLIGVLFILIGNYMPKTRQTYTVGIRLPWTLASEENWNRTHRFASKLWVLCGFLFILEGFYAQSIGSTIGIMLVFIVILCISAIPAVYSFLLYKKGI